MLDRVVKVNAQRSKLRMAKSVSKYRRSALAIATVGLFGMPGISSAMQLETDNPDLALRWDNNVRISAGWRMQAQDPALLNSPASQESDSRFAKGDMVTKRIDLLSEFEAVWKKEYGFRLSAAGWYDAAYSNQTVSHSAFYTPATSTYANNKYSALTDRFYHQGGEILDAFVFANTDINGMPSTAKLGQFSTFWGSGLFYGNGISQGQQPIDARKAIANPGSEIRELFLPLKQVLIQSQVTSEVSVAAQYYLDWAPSRFPEGGTYLGAADMILAGPNYFGAAGGAGFGMSSVTMGPDHKSGNVGLSVKLTPESWSGSALTLYYRKFDDKIPWFFINPAGFFGAVYGQGTEIYGASVDTTIGAWAFGAEAGYHKHAAMNAVGFGVPFNGSTAGPYGNTWHALVNTIVSVDSPAWSSSVFVAELAYDRWASVTSDPSNLFNRVGTAACVNGAIGTPGSGSVGDGCSTKDAWGLSVAFTPTYNQVLPGIDVSIPFHASYGLKGNSALADPGNNEGSYTYQIGVEADLYRKATVNLSYQGGHTKMRTPNVPGLGSIAVGGNGLGYGTNDRGWLSLTLKSSF